MNNLEQGGINQQEEGGVLQKVQEQGPESLPSSIEMSDGSLVKTEALEGVAMQAEGVAGLEEKHGPANNWNREAKLSTARVMLASFLAGINIAKRGVEEVADGVLHKAGGLGKSAIVAGMMGVAAVGGMKPTEAQAIDFTAPAVQSMQVGINTEMQKRQIEGQRSAMERQLQANVRQVEQQIAQKEARTSAFFDAQINQAKARGDMATLGRLDGEKIKAMGQFAGDRAALKVAAEQEAKKLGEHIKVQVEQLNAQRNAAIVNTFINQIPTIVLGRR